VAPDGLRVAAPRRDRSVPAAMNAAFLQAEHAAKRPQVECEMA
jgi:hypothetical protein